MVLGKFYDRFVSEGGATPQEKAIKLMLLAAKLQPGRSALLAPLEEVGP